MTITKIISSGASGAEQAALDVAIRLKIPYGGFTMESAMLDPFRTTRRYKLLEKEFQSTRSKDEANLHITDATLIFTHGALSRDLFLIDDYAVTNGHPSLHVDLDEMEPLEAALHISIWTGKHPAESLFVTGSREEDDKRIYQEAYDALYSLLMLDKGEDPAPEKPTEEMKPYPKQVEEAVQRLMDELPLREKVIVANMTADEVGDLHFSVGTYIRNSFGLWNANDHLMWSCAKEAGRGNISEDEASAIILDRLAIELERTHKLRTV